MNELSHSPSELKSEAVKEETSNVTSSGGAPLLSPARPAPADGSAEEMRPLEFLLQTKHHGSRLPMIEETQRADGVPKCGRCETLPDAVRGPGTLHLRVALSHTLGKVLGELKKSGLSYTVNGAIVSVRVEGEDLTPVVTPLIEALLPNERKDARSMFQPDGRELSLSSYLDMSEFSTLAGRVESEWLMSLLREERLHMVFQPIVRPQTENRDGQTPLHVYGYECLMRGIVDGQIVSPAVMLDAARASELMFQLDLAARRAAIVAAARLDVPGRIFINFGPTGIYDPVNCLRSTVTLVDRQKLSRDRIVFEIIESDHEGDIGHLQRIVNYYRDNGFAVALDDFGAGYASLNLLHKLRPDFIKLDMELTRDVHRDPYKALIARKMLETARELGAQSVAEGIENSEEFAWVDHHGADFMQGYYFARPASPPPLLPSPVQFIAPTPKEEAELSVR